jgi:hypothetical protein
VTQALRDLYTRKGAEISLHERKRSLADRGPVDMLASGTRLRADVEASVPDLGPLSNASGGAGADAMAISPSSQSRSRAPVRRGKP